MEKVLILILILSPSLSLAGQSDGTIKMIQAGDGYTPENIYFLVEMNSPHTNKPACATDDRFALNPATQPGKTQISMLMAAHAAGKRVYINGNGSCSVMGNEFEDINYIRVY